jgi:two-component system response regulator YesN
LPFNILLVDDDKEFREEFRDYFEEYGFVEAATGEEALAILGKPNEIDLVILDVVMPGIRGTEVLKSIKQMRPDLGVVILTGFGTKNMVIEALKGKADEYIEKPLDTDQTREVIARLLRARTSPEGTGGAGVEAKIKRVMYFLQRNYDKNVSLKDAASLACLSPKYLSRAFARTTGIGFNQYRARVKSRRAADLLTKTDYNIEEISTRLGYENPESFARAFKKTSGLAPSAYRARERAVASPGAARRRAGRPRRALKRPAAKGRIANERTPKGRTARR